MDRTFWFKQSREPLFGELVWSRPENRSAAGKLLIVGGNLHGFSAVAQAYAAADKAGVGTARVLLPDAIKKTVGKVLDNASFVPSTPSGSFSQRGLAELIETANWADGVLMAGDFGRNSETAILIEKFLTKYSGPVTITKDVVEYISSSPQLVERRQETLVVCSLSQLQRLLTTLKYPRAISLSMSLLQLVELLHDVTQTYAFSVTVKHQNNLIVAVASQVSTTVDDDTRDLWQVRTAASQAVWWLQVPTKPFEALTTALCK